MKKYTFNAGTAGLVTLVPPTPAEKFQSNLVAWWRADAGVTYAPGMTASAASVSLVSAIADQSATGANLTQSNSQLSLTRLAPARNGLPGLFGSDAHTTNYQQNLVGTHQAALAFDHNTPFSVGVAYVAGAYMPNGWLEWMLGQLNPAGFKGWAVAASFGSTSTHEANLWIADYNNGIRLCSSTPYVPGTAYNYIFSYDGSGNSSGINIYLNGVQDTAPTYSGANGYIGSALDSGSVPFLGAGVNNSTVHNHTLLEAFIVNRAVTAAEVTTMDGYINTRWAIH